MESQRVMSGLNNDPMDTIGAAATAIASAENRRPRASLQKKRWGSCWSINWCFGSHKHKKRIGHAVLVPETIAQGTEAPQAENPIHQPSVVLPFIAPPSSPASFLQSEPPSCTQSPPGLLSLTSVSATMYSPVPTSMFTIGPYAYETQLVSPPVFSTFTTEPSTAPFTPPPEAVQLTTPSSPEVPFARLLDPNYQSGEGAQRYPISQYEFQLYQLYSGINVGRLISPGSGISSSGTSSPFPDGEYTPGGPRLIQSQPGYPSKLFNLDRRSIHRWGSQQGSGSLTPDSVGPRSHDGFVLNKQDSDIETLGNSFYKSRNSETVHDPRISFEITAEDVVRCMAKEPSLAKAVSSSVEFEDTRSEREGNYNEVANCHMGNHGEIADDSSGKASGEEEDGQGHRKHRSATLDSIKEFNFDNTDGGNSDRAAIGPNWWANEKALEKEGESYKVWSFFPMIQSGIS